MKNVSHLTMDNYVPFMRDKLVELKALAATKRKCLDAAPKGFLRTSKSNGTLQFYIEDDKESSRRVYVSKKDLSSARKIAQRDYDKKMLQSTEKLIDATERFLSCYDKFNLMEVQKNFPKNRRGLLTPDILLDNEFIELWQNEPFEGKNLSEETPMLETANGIMVRSKSELLIADALDKYHVPFRYECPMTLKRNIVVYPDFTCLNVRTRSEVVWEHFGMMDDADYSAKTALKMRSYENSGLLLGKQIVFTMETRNQPLNSKYAEQIVKRYLL